MLSAAAAINQCDLVTRNIELPKRVVGSRRRRMAKTEGGWIITVYIDGGEAEPSVAARSRVVRKDDGARGNNAAKTPQQSCCLTRQKLDPSSRISVHGIS